MTEDPRIIEQRDANESLVLAALRAEEAADSARGGQEIAEAVARALRQGAEELRKAKVDLELALAESARLNQELMRAAVSEKAARAEAEDANRAKDEFLAMLGHELRNPLAPIVTALSLMRLRGDASSREHEVIERQVEHVVRLVDDLLDVSRITRGKVELVRAPVELAEIIAVATEMANPLIVQRAHQLTVAVPTHGLLLDVDKARIAQVISNLLTNAARYTPPRGKISVSAARVDDTIEIVVSDTGVGIEPEMLSRVFDLFFQATQSSDRGQGGLGLGLALVRNLVTLHDGTVEARSEGRGRGTTVVVRLPALPLPQSLPLPLPVENIAHVEPDQNSAVGPCRVLVVDDNEDATAMLVELLRMRGYDVLVAHDGPAALALLANVDVDVALLDIGLPGMDGYELAARIRERPSMKQAHLIALTGYGQARDRERSRVAGFDKHLVKPVDISELLIAVSHGRKA